MRSIDEILGLQPSDEFVNNSNYAMDKMKEYQAANPTPPSAPTTLEELTGGVGKFINTVNNASWYSSKPENVSQEDWQKVMDNSNALGVGKSISNWATQASNNLDAKTPYVQPGFDWVKYQIMTQVPALAGIAAGALALAKSGNLGAAIKLMGGIEPALGEGAGAVLGENAGKISELFANKGGLANAVGEGAESILPKLGVSADTAANIGDTIVNSPLAKIGYENPELAAKFGENTNKVASGLADLAPGIQSQAVIAKTFAMDSGKTAYNQAIKDNHTPEEAQTIANNTESSQFKLFMALAPLEFASVLGQGAKTMKAISPALDSRTARLLIPPVTGALQMGGSSVLTDMDANKPINWPNALAAGAGAAIPMLGLGAIGAIRRSPTAVESELKGQLADANKNVDAVTQQSNNVISKDLPEHNAFIENNFAGSKLQAPARQLLAKFNALADAPGITDEQRAYYTQGVSALENALSKEGWAAGGRNDAKEAIIKNLDQFPDGIKLSGKVIQIPDALKLPLDQYHAQQQAAPTGSNVTSTFGTQQEAQDFAQKNGIVNPDIQNNNGKFTVNGVSDPSQTNTIVPDHAAYVTKNTEAFNNVIDSGKLNPQDITDLQGAIIKHQNGDSADLAGLMQKHLDNQPVEQAPPTPVQPQEPVVNQDILNQAHDAAANGDYVKATQLANQSGSKMYTELYARMRDKPPDESVPKPEVQTPVAPKEVTGTVDAGLHGKFDLVKPNTPDTINTANMGTNIGLRVKFFDGSKKPYFNGFYTTGDKRTVYVNASSTRSHFWVLGHEYGHFIVEGHPDLYKALSSLIKPEEMNRYFHDFLENGTRKFDLNNPNDIKYIKAEMICDTLANHWLDKSFWQGVKDRSPSLFKKMIDIVNKFLDKVSGKKNGMDVNQEFNDAVKSHFQDIIAEVNNTPKGKGGTNSIFGNVTKSKDEVGHSPDQMPEPQGHNPEDMPEQGIPKDTKSVNILTDTAKPKSKKEELKARKQALKEATNKKDVPPDDILASEENKPNFAEDAIKKFHDLGSPNRTDFVKAMLGDPEIVKKFGTDFINYNASGTFSRIKTGNLGGETAKATKANSDIKYAKTSPNGKDSYASTLSPKEQAKVLADLPTKKYEISLRDGQPFDTELFDKWKDGDKPLTEEEKKNETYGKELNSDTDGEPLNSSRHIKAEEPSDTIVSHELLTKEELTALQNDKDTHVISVSKQVTPDEGMVKVKYSDPSGEKTVTMSKTGLKALKDSPHVKIIEIKKANSKEIQESGKEPKFAVQYSRKNKDQSTPISENVDQYGISNRDKFRGENAKDIQKIPVKGEEIDPKYVKYNSWANGYFLAKRNGEYGVYSKKSGYRVATGKDRSEALTATKDSFENNNKELQKSLTDYQKAKLAGDKELTDTSKTKLVKSLEPSLISDADKVHAKSYGELEKPELVSAGQEALLKLIDSYHGDAKDFKGLAFGRTVDGVYKPGRIEFAMRDAVKEAGTNSKYTTGLVEKYKKALDVLEGQDKHAPSHVEIAKTMNELNKGALEKALEDRTKKYGTLSDKDKSDITKRFTFDEKRVSTIEETYNRHDASLDKPIGEGDNASSLKDTIPDAPKANDNRASAKVRAAIKVMTPEEVRILELKTGSKIIVDDKGVIVSPTGSKPDAVVLAKKLNEFNKEGKYDFLNKDPEGLKAGKFTTASAELLQKSKGGMNQATWEKFIGNVMGDEYRKPMSFVDVTNKLNKERATGEPIRTPKEVEDIFNSVKDGLKETNNKVDPNKIKISKLDKTLTDMGINPKEATAEQINEANSIADEELRTAPKAEPLILPTGDKIAMSDVPTDNKSYIKILDNMEPNKLLETMNGIKGAPLAEVHKVVNMLKNFTGDAAALKSARHKISDLINTYGYKNPKQETVPFHNIDIGGKSRIGRMKTLLADHEAALEGPTNRMTFNGKEIEVSPSMKKMIQDSADHLKSLLDEGDSTHLMASEEMPTTDAGKHLAEEFIGEENMKKIRDKMGIADKGVRVQEKIKDPSTMSYFQQWFSSPSVIAAKRAEFKPVFDMANASIRLETRLKGSFQGHLDHIYTNVLGLDKEDRKLLNTFRMMSDERRKDLAPSEMRALGGEQNVIDAFTALRNHYNRLHGLTNSIRKNMGIGEIGKLDGYIPHIFDNWMVHYTDGQGVRQNETYKTKSEAVARGNALQRDGEKDVVARMLRKEYSKDKQVNAFVPDELTPKQARELDSAIKLEGEDFAEPKMQDLTGKIESETDAHRFLSFAQQRKGVSGWNSKDLRSNDMAYANKTARYLAVEPFRAKATLHFERTFAKGEIGAMDKWDWTHNDIAQYMKKYIKDVNGNPTNIEAHINKLLENSYLGSKLGSYFGDRYSVQLANGITDAMTVAKLGFFKPASAIVHFNQLTNAYSLIGEKHLAYGMSRAGHLSELTTGEKRALKLLYIKNDMSNSSGYVSGNSGFNILNKALPLTAKGLQYSMVFFKRGVQFTKETAILGAYHKGLEDFHGDVGKALKYAEDVDRRTNFDYGVGDSAQLFRNFGPVGQVILQFKKYPIKQLEFVTHLVSKGVFNSEGAKANARFWASMIAMSGVNAVPGADALKEIFNQWYKLNGEKKDFNSEMTKMLVEMGGGSPTSQALAKQLLYGGFSHLGVDVSKRLGMSDIVPTSPSSFFGPALSTTYNFTKAMFINSWAESYPEMVKAITPALGDFAQAYVGHSTSMTDNGKVNYKYSDGEKAVRAAGFNPLGESIQRDQTHLIKYTASQMRDEKQKAINDAATKGDDVSLQKAKELGVTTKEIIKAAKKKSESNLDRAEDSISKKDKKKGTYDDINNFSK